MNKQAYRVIFNTTRGQSMAVAETVSSRGKRAGSGSAARRPRTPLLRFATLGVMIAAVFGNVTLVHAQMVAYKNGVGPQPIIDRTASGRPIVQIVTPNAAGVSHNRYEQFNVDSGGAILNNARTITQTQLGGMVDGNPHLANGSARVILNEVMSTNRSHLNGYIEVAGQRADVIVANPNGIVVGGRAGFINASRGVLTTGTPVFGGEGSLDAFRVRRGTIQIEAGGLGDKETEQLDLFARSVKVNAALWANRLNVVAGANVIDYSKLGVTIIEGEDGKPTVAIDSSELGGMYAGKIMLVGNEYGVGVNLVGDFAISADDMTIDSAGKLTLKGKTSAQGNITLRSGDDISNSGSLYGQQSVAIHSAGQVSNSGMLAAHDDLSVNAAAIDASGTFGAGVDAAARATQAGNLNLNASGAITATGHNTSGGNVTMTGANLNVSNAQTSSGGAATFTAKAGDIDHSGGTVQAAGSATLNAAGSVINDRGTLHAAQFASHSAALSNVGGSITQSGSGDTHITTGGALDNRQGTITTNAHNLTVQAGGLANDGGHLTHAGNGTFTLRAGVASNVAGEIATNGQLTVNAANLDNNRGYLSGDRLTLHVAGDIDNTQGKIEGLHNGVAISANSLNNAAGTLQSLGAAALNIDLQQGLRNTAADGVGGFIGSGGKVDVTAGNIDNSQGTLYSKDTLALNADGTLSNHAGSIGSERT